MTNEKQELFTTLGLIAEESVNEVKKEEPEVEKTCLESVEAELAELDSIDKSLDEYEKASFESLVSDLDLLNQVLAYKSIKTAGTEEAALESISAEFGIANEGIKELAEKGVKAGKALIAKIVKLIKSLFGVEETKKKVVKQLVSKAKAAGLNKSVEMEITTEDYQKYAELFIHAYLCVSQYNIETGEFMPAQGVSVPADIKPLLDKFIDKFTSESNIYREKAKALVNAPESEQFKLLIEGVNLNNIFLKNPASRPIEGLKELTVPEGFKIGPALINLAQILAKDPFDKVWRDIIKGLEQSSEEKIIPKYVASALISVVTNMRKFKQGVIRSLTVMMGKYISRYKSANQKTA